MVNKTSGAVAEPARVRGRGLAHALSRLEDPLYYVLHHRMGVVGVAILTFVAIMALFPQLFTPYAPTQIFEQNFAPPSPQHLCGTDYEGKDVWTQIIYGARASLLVGFIATILTIAIGGFIGVFSGYYGGVLDNLLMFFSDSLMLLPSLLLLIVFATMFRNGFIVAKLTGVGRWTLWDTAIVIALIAWPSTARMVRAQVMQLKNRPYVEAIRIIGAGPWRIMFKHILPQTTPLLLSRITVLTPGFMVTAASLSFLGLGDPNTPDWGYVMYTAYKNMFTVVTENNWLWIVLPGLLLAITVMGFICVGEAIDDYLNPKRRR